MYVGWTGRLRRGTDAFLGERATEWVGECDQSTVPAMKAWAKGVYMGLLAYTTSVFVGRNQKIAVSNNVRFFSIGIAICNS